MSRTDDGGVTDHALAETFDVCSDCGTPSVQLESHRCSSDPEDDRDGRDPYPDEETVLVLTSFGQTQYPYHDLDADGDPLCPASRDSTATEYTREQAIARGFEPCEFCQRIRHSNDREDHAEAQAREVSVCE